MEGVASSRGKAVIGTATGIQGGKDCVAHALKKRDDYGISDRVNAVHPIGSPIIHSSKLAQRTLPISVPRNGLLDPPHSSKRPTVWFLPPFTPDGVGNNDCPVPVMGSANVGSRYAIDFRIITERGQGSENLAQPSIMQRCHVLQQDDAGSNHANGSHDLPKQSTAGSGKSGALSCIAQVLAGESGGDYIRINSAKIGGRYVAKVGDAGETFTQDCAGVWRDLAQRHGFKASPVQAKVHRAAPREHRKHAQFFSGHKTPAAPTVGAIRAAGQGGAGHGSSPLAVKIVGLAPEVKTVAVLKTLWGVHRHDDDPHRGQDEPGGNRDDERGHAAAACVRGRLDGRTLTRSSTVTSLWPCLRAAARMLSCRHVGMISFMSQLFTVEGGTPTFAAIGRIPPNLSKTLSKGDAFADVL